MKFENNSRHFYLMKPKNEIVTKAKQSSWNLSNILSQLEQGLEYKAF